MAPRCLTILFALTAALRTDALRRPNSRVSDGAVSAMSLRGGGGEGGKEPSDEPRRRIGVLRVSPWLNKKEFDLTKPPEAARGFIDIEDATPFHLFDVLSHLTFNDCQKGGTPPNLLEFTNRVTKLARNVDAITGDCGFMLNFQKWAQTAANRNKDPKDFTPVFMSSLLQAPLLEKIFGGQDLPESTTRSRHHYQKPDSLQEVGPFVAIITANSEAASWSGKAKEDLFKLAGIIDEKVFAVLGTDQAKTKRLYHAIDEGTPLDTKMREELLEVCEMAKAKHPNVRCFLFECTELPPYASYIREKTGLPVFDIVTLTDLFYESQNDRHKFSSPPSKND